MHDLRRSSDIKIEIKLYHLSTTVSIDYEIWVWCDAFIIPTYVSDNLYDDCTLTF